MTAHRADDRTGRNRHQFSLDGVRLWPYYSSGDFLKAKHNAADAATDRFPDWVLGLIDDVPATRALDAGCGWGRFSVPLLRRRSESVVPALTCSDVYPGMIETARRTVTDAGLHATYVVAGIETLPFLDGSFDVVMANHVLYHMNSVFVAAAELARALDGDGRLVATTNSDLVRVPLLEIHRAVLHELGISTPPEEPSKFSLENGA